MMWKQTEWIAGLEQEQERKQERSQEPEDSLAANWKAAHHNCWTVSLCDLHLHWPVAMDLWQEKLSLQQEQADVGKGQGRHAGDEEPEPIGIGVGLWRRR